jgi:hypothetical protein
MVERAFGGSPNPYTNKNDLISINPSNASKQLQSGINTNSYPALDVPRYSGNLKSEAPTNLLYH